ncbi:hypothetical protein BDV93DRAFT_442049 [Ceratobasidium sp. AG-I]|nr:hypothetical protein BDV93DRAFT_442049 [Ceratobasidium sp. AG-I]
MQKSRKRKLQDDCNQKAPSKRPWIEANQLKDNSNNNQEVPIATEVDLIPPLHDTSKFLDFATPEELKDCHRRFRAATSNERLAQDVCASCARLLMRDDLTLVDYLSQPNRQLLVPKRPHKSHILTHGMLLLYPKAGRDQPDTLQTALKGNVTTYTANAQAVVDMLQGQLMPRATTILPSLIAVTFVGRRSVSKSRLKTIFRVRRKIHPGYAQLDISREALFLLPEDDVPEEILATLHLELDESVVERESAGYVPPEGNNAQLKSRNTLGQKILVSHNIHEDVIPLEFSGTAAADGTQITSKELMLSAIKNLKKELGDRMSAEGAYAVRHGGFARDFGYLKRGEDTSEDTHEDENPSAWTFPSLFPYGVGGLEAKRAVPVSFMEHTRVCLQHYDRRFRRDHMFPYWSMSIQQKRQALNAARLTMGRKDFDRTSAILTQLTEADLTKATQEEETGRSFSDARIVLLRKTVQVTMQKVMGSNASRALNRSKMWSTSLYLNPVNLWMTLNLVDRHDPICQIFAGENIDMDNLQGMLGLSAQDRARNVAEDPFAAAQFFFFLANTILETLFGFTPHARTGDGRMGALGLGNAYYGMVEAQGRGSLHLHMLMWLRDSPHAGEVKLKLQSESFREKIKAYLQANIRSHLDGLTKTVLKSMKSTTELAWSRPPDPDSPTYEVDLKTLETKLVRSQQYHTCAPNTCLVFDKKARRLVCKRRAPFELSPEDVVTETGIIRTKRTVGRLNAWCPAVFYGGRCNNDIKYISNGAEARGYAWYTTNYATKEQGATYNGTGIMTKTWVDHQSRLPTLDNLRENNKSFIFRCGLSLNKEMEYSGQQVMAYLMGWGDSITSHTYTSIYWSLVVRSLKATYPELVSKSEAEKQDSVSIILCAYAMMLTCCSVVLGRY